MLLKWRSQISNTDTENNYLHPSVRRQLGKELLGQIIICNLHLSPWLKVWGTVQTWGNFCPLCFTDSGNAVQQSTSQIFGKSRRWERYQGATRVFIYHRPAVLIAEQFHIFLINCWVTEIPQIIFCQSNSDVFGAEEHKRLPQRRAELYMQTTTFITSHIFLEVSGFE